MRFIKSKIAEAELVGEIIILGITLTGISMIALYGVPTILGLQDMSNLRNAEQTFAVFDSRASRTVLGSSPIQITDISLGGGTLTVVPNSTNSLSYIAIRDKNNTFNFTVPMGKVEYQLGSRIVAFEGGGVWSEYPSGTILLSRPEFNYNGWTLTLPVFNISGNASMGGKGTAIVSIMKNPPLVVFPNTSRPGWINRTNPVNYTVVGTVFVNITSDFYDAWANYIGTVSSVNVVSEDAKNHTVGIVLTVYPPYIGKMNSYISDPIVFRGLDPTNSTPLDNFSFRIYSSNFNSFDWEIAAQSGNRRLIYELQGNKTYVNLYIGYEDDGSGYENPAETWDGAAFPIQGTNPNQYIDVDLLNTSINETYEKTKNDVGNNNGKGCVKKIESDDFNKTGFSWTDRIVNTTPPYNQQSLYNITQHYIQIMSQNGDISFGQCTNGGNGPVSGSTMYINYYAPAGLTFLDVTDNKADVSIS